MTTDQVEMKGGLLQVYKWMLHLFYINAVALIATWQVVAGSLSKFWGCWFFILAFISSPLHLNSIQGRAQGWTPWTKEEKKIE